jgi:hypothetical protein
MRWIVEKITLRVDLIPDGEIVWSRHGLHLFERRLIDSDAGRIDLLDLRGAEINRLTARVRVADNSLPEV